MPEQPSNVHRSTVRALSTAMIVVGIVLAARAIAEGGGPLSIGVVAGVLFVAAGAGRWYLTLRRP